jgi:hypothetical protein
MPRHNIKENVKKKTFTIHLRKSATKHDMLIVMGDFNAKVGKEAYHKQVAGMHTIHESSNENGRMLGQSATRNNMLIKSTVYPPPHNIYIWEHGRYLGPTKKLIRSIMY